MTKDSIFIKLLKKYTTIDKTFINTFFKKYKIGGDLDFDLEDNDIAFYLNIKLSTLRKRLLNFYTKKKVRYIEKVDYIRIKSEDTYKVKYMINYQCFERLAMSGDSDNSEIIRLYFTKLREFITENQHLIFQALENKDDLKLYSKFETIYFFAVDEKKNFFKIGHTGDIIQRLRNYNIGRIKEIDLKYLALVKNKTLIENCMKLKLNKNQVIKNREIYEIDPRKLKKIINDCYCKHISKKENEELYKELSNLLGMYTYVKNKVNIKPYIIIGNEL
jgi:hypothetical protein